MNQLIFMRQSLLLMRTTGLLLPHCPTTYLIPHPCKPRGFQLDEASIYTPNFPMGPETTSPNWVASHFPALRQVSLWGSCHSHGAAEGHETLPSGKELGCLCWRLQSWRLLCWIAVTDLCLKQETEPRWHNFGHTQPGNCINCLYLFIQELCAAFFNKKFEPHFV